MDDEAKMIRATGRKCTTASLQRREGEETGKKGKTAGELEGAIPPRRSKRRRTPDKEKRTKSMTRWVRKTGAKTKKEAVRKKRNGRSAEKQEPTAVLRDRQANREESRRSRCATNRTASQVKSECSRKEEGQRVTWAEHAPGIIRTRCEIPAKKR